MKAKHVSERCKAIAREWFLAISLATTLVFALLGEKVFDALSNPLWLAVIFIWLFGVVLGSALSVVRHADRVAEILGEPYGTLVLTLSVTAIEVLSITAVMLHGANNPTLVRDTLFSIVMIILGGMVGGSLLLGGWRHREQHYNLQSANAYLGVIIPLSVLTLTLPDFTITTPGPTLSFAQQTFLVVMSLGLYGAFLAIQTGRHRGYFVSDEDEADAAAGNAAGGRARCAGTRPCWSPISCRWCSWPNSSPTRSIISSRRCRPRPRSAASSSPCWWRRPRRSAPRARPWPTGCSARSISSLGSVLSTIGLTVPAMLAISHFTKHEVYLGLDQANDVLLAADARRLRRDLCQRPHQHPAGRGARDAVCGILDADNPGLTAHGRRADRRPRHGRLNPRPWPRQNPPFNRT